MVSVLLVTVISTSVKQFQSILPVIVTNLFYRYDPKGYFLFLRTESKMFFASEFFFLFFKLIFFLSSFCFIFFLRSHFMHCTSFATEGANKEREKEKEVSVTAEIGEVNSCCYTF